MRPIKFRYWNGYAKAMYPAEYFGLTLDGKFLVQLADKSFVIRNHQKRDGLMQFTGLLDKNGSDIYEGDILTSNPEVKFVVVWSEGQDSRTVGFFVHKLLTNEYYPITANQWDMEVIGNIYSNPELLQ